MGTNVTGVYNVTVKKSTGDWNHEHRQRAISAVGDGASVGLPEWHDVGCKQQQFQSLKF